MNKLILLFSLVIFTFCSTNKISTVDQVKGYQSFGEKINAEGAISQQEMLKKYKALNVGDTINVKFISKVNSVCKKKGCFMKLQLDAETESMVKFKNYEFFVPKDSENSQAIVQGKAYVSELSVKELKHYAEDAGKSKEEIAAITEPEVYYNFLATGVLLK